MRKGHAFAHAWCLFPGEVATPDRENITYGSPTGPVGALCLRPGSERGFKNLCALLSRWLSAEELSR